MKRAEAARRFARALTRALREVAGAPDYDAYLEHMALCHPDAPVLTRAEFAARAIDRKYGRSGPRCCQG